MWSVRLLKFKKFVVFLYIASIRQQMQQNKVQLRENKELMCDLIEKIIRKEIVTYE